MMGHRQVEQAVLFYEFSLEGNIPTDHLLRSIDRFVDLEQVRQDLAPFCYRDRRRRHRRGADEARFFDYSSIRTIKGAAIGPPREEIDEHS